MEGKKIPNRLEQAPRLQTEEGLHNIHKIVNGLHHAPAEDRVHAEHIIHETSAGTEYDRHNDGRTLAIEHLELSIKNVLRVLEQMPAEDRDEEEWAALLSHRKLLSVRVSEIQKAAGHYAQSVEKFSHLSKQKMRLTPEDFRDAFERADSTRRNNHEHLIAALQLYNATMRWFADEGYLSGMRVHEWKEGIPVPPPSEISEQKLPLDLYIFPVAFLNDRKSVQQWGIAEAFRDSVKLISTELEKAQPR